ncbi:MAG: aminopeptidase, partial [Desulfovibrio sp.]|nr:aminopeptidase [Desulfovibrio sp.]
DALAYAQKFYQPSAIIDIATLTGACAVALGNELAGLFASDDDLGEKIMAIGAACGENYWRLPLWPGYRESLKSEIADIKHTASRDGGAITAALFLKNFVSDDIPWVHLDIAGVDWTGKTKPACPEGASGFGIRTLLELCRGGLK